jgi:hypothetical protein
MTDQTDQDPDVADATDRTTTCPACGTTDVTQTNTQDVHYRYTRNADHTTPTVTVPIYQCAKGHVWSPEPPGPSVRADLNPGATGRTRR